MSCTTPPSTSTAQPTSCQYIDVETQLDPLAIDCGNGLTVRLTGTMDRARVAEAEGGIVIPDVKTGARIISDGKAVTRGHAAQTGTYQLMYEHTKKVRTVGAQIIALSTGAQTQTDVSPIFDARRVMVGEDGQPGLIEHAAAMFRTGLFPPNPSSVLCSEKYCARWRTCLFHQ
jgi:hypothetical protein